MWTQPELDSVALQIDTQTALAVSIGVYQEVRGLYCSNVYDLQ